MGEYGGYAIAEEGFFFACFSRLEGDEDVVPVQKCEGSFEGHQELGSPRTVRCIINEMDVVVHGVSGCILRRFQGSYVYVPAGVGKGGSGQFPLFLEPSSSISAMNMRGLRPSCSANCFVSFTDCIRSGSLSLFTMGLLINSYRNSNDFLSYAHYTAFNGHFK